MIRNARTRNRRLGRLFQNMKRPGAEIVLSEKQFQLELKKEVYRSDRREFGREIGLVWLRSVEEKDSIDSADLLESPGFGQVLGRLRIADSIGWYKGSLAILLPESSREGTLVLANEVTRILADFGWDVVAEVSTYPMDDELNSVAKEIQKLSRAPQDDESNNGSDDDQFNGGRRDLAHLSVAKPKSKVLAAGDISRADDVNQDVWASGSTAVAELPEGKIQQTTNQKGLLPLRVVEKQHRFVASAKTPWWKRVVDITGALAGLILLSPVLIFSAIAIKATSKGPVFFRQMREGKDGRMFGILKFRTMVVNAETLQGRLRRKNEQDGPAFKLTNDPRVTAIGRYLRRSCVDELPQLWNILKGEMSLVGPRPLPVDESLACTAWQRARLTVLPGLTCTWQAYGGRDVKFAQWMQMDLDYIQRRSFWFDLKLIFDTARMALMHRGSV